MEGNALVIIGLPAALFIIMVGMGLSLAVGDFRRVAEQPRGVAIGLFWAFAFPVAQILLAVVFCVWWRGNIAVAAGLTLVTNPFTIGFWLWLSYRTGSLVLVAPPPAPVTENAGVMTWLASVGAPTLLGMGIFAVGGAAAGYIIVKLAWRVRIWFKRRHR